MQQQQQSCAAVGFVADCEWLTFRTTVVGHPTDVDTMDLLHDRRCRATAETSDNGDCKERVLAKRSGRTDSFAAQRGETRGVVVEQEQWAVELALGVLVRSAAASTGCYRASAGSLLTVGFGSHMPR